MRVKICTLLVVFLFIGCDQPGDCIKSTGPFTSKVIDVPVFEKIIVHNGIALVISQGPEYNVEVRTGENLIDDIEVTVVDNTLTLEDNTTCNWVRDYGQTTVYVTAPNLTDIYSKTEKNIISEGIITFPNLRLVAMDLNDGYIGTGSGNYILEVNNEKLVIDCNTLSKITISGKTKNLNANVYEGGGIIDTQNLLANDIQFYHRGSNNMFLNPIDAIIGDIYNIGNVISFNKPPIVNVTQHYKGKLIFK